MKKISRRSFLDKSILSAVALGTFPATGIAGNPQSPKKEKLPVFAETDICVLGGSCTGVFAAVRAARLGARVCIVEKQNAFGGVATNAFVNVWHSLLDTEYKLQIIAGMTTEMIDRLEKRKAVHKAEKNESIGFRFNSEELKIELDEVILEAGVKPFFHTLFSEPLLDNSGKLTGVIVDNKSGRGIIKAKYFIDATGDGDLCFRLGLPSYTHPLLQPPTTCAHLEKFDRNEIDKLLKEHRNEFDIPEGFVWGGNLPASETFMLAGTRVFGADCAVADDLTRAEIEGRRQVRAIMDMFRKYGKNPDVLLNGLPSSIGIRETRHIKCLYQVTDDDALYGKRFDDAIANGSYRLDIHHQEKPGLTFRYLDGTEKYISPGKPTQSGRWRPATSENPTFYQVPLRSIIPGKYDNLMLAGRMLDASSISFSGIRVMVNMNQLGEAAGVTSYLALNQNIPVAGVNSKTVRETLKKGGSIII